jgi:hypothetical protein
MILLKKMKASMNHGEHSRARNVDLVLGCLQPSECNLVMEFEN